MDDNNTYCDHIIYERSCSVVQTCWAPTRRQLHQPQHSTRSGQQQPCQPQGTDISKNGVRNRAANAIAQTSAQDELIVYATCANARVLQPQKKKSNNSQTTNTEVVGKNSTDVLWERNVRSTCLVASLSTPRYFASPTGSRMQLLFLVQIHAPHSARSGGRQQLLKAHVLEVLLRISFCVVVRQSTAGVAFSRDFLALPERTYSWSQSCSPSMCLIFPHPPHAKMPLTAEESPLTLASISSPSSLQN